MAPSLRAALITSTSPVEFWPHQTTFVAGAGAEVEQHVGELVRLRVELGDRSVSDVAVRPVVDDGELVGLDRGVRGEEVGHEDTA